MPIQAVTRDGRFPADIVTKLHAVVISAQVQAYQTVHQPHRAKQVAHMFIHVYHATAVIIHSLQSVLPETGRLFIRAVQQSGLRLRPIWR